jgi:SAM-dependent methyltransferase
MGDVDLSRPARGYDHRPTSTAARERARAEASLAGLGGGGVALDVGGGRGDHAAEFAGTGARALVVDRSPEMVAEARRHRGVGGVVGDGGRLPIRTGSIDLVYFHVSLQYGGWEDMVDEGLRVLRPGGRIAVWTFAPEHFGRSFLARWFPSVAPIDAGRFPDPGAIAARLAAGGCEGIAIDAEREAVERTAGGWEAAAAGRFVSTLQMLPPGELEAGLRRFREAHPDPAAPVRYSLEYRRVSGTTPRLRLT